MPIPEEVRKKVFVSYSHTDSEWLKRVQTHLKDLTRRGMVDLWDDTKIQSGSQWREEIRGALESAKVAVLLISADFIASDFIAEDELPPLLAAAEKDGVKILSLILSPSRYEKIESLSKYQSINPLSKPLIGLSKVEQEAYLVKLSDDVLRAAEEAPTTPTGASGAVRPRIFNLPFSRNKFFTGRDDILKGIHKSFSEGEKVQALSGIGGVGKTQTALQYAYQYQGDYRIVLWGNANSRETLVTDFVAMAGLLNLPEKNAQDQSESVNAVKRWFGNNDGWLLILDNADELAMAREFIPSSETGRILLTTRAQNTKPIAARQAVEKMQPQEGALFLLRRLEEIKKDEQLESAPEGLRKQAEALSKAVDGLPLALDQAAAFIEETPSTLEEYQTLYQSKRKELLKRRGNLAEDHPSVTVTFSLAFKKMAEANPAAADLLRVCAFLEADSIPEEIFSEGAIELGEALRSTAESSLALTDAIGEAARFSLLRRHPEARTVSLHRLVQAVLRDEMDSDARRMWAERAVRALDKVFPKVVKYEVLPFCGRLISHAQLLASFIYEYGFDFPEAARLMDQAGSYFKWCGQYAEAEPLLQRALDIHEKALGPEHPDTANSLHNLSALYRRRGRYAEAEPLLQSAIDIREKMLGPEHPDTAVSLNSLGLLYQEQGKYAEAEPLFKRALAIKEKALGPEHPNTAVCLMNLGSIYQDQGRYAEAEPLLQRALDIHEKALGPEHPDTALSLHNLAALYGSQGRYIVAEPLYRRALDLTEKALGAEHPGTAMQLNNLAFLYDSQGRYAEAESLYRRALGIYEKALGPWHPNTVRVLQNYAALLRKMSREDEADELEARRGT